MSLLMLSFITHGSTLCRPTLWNGKQRREKNLNREDLWKTNVFLVIRALSGRKETENKKQDVHLLWKKWNRIRWQVLHKWEFKRRVLTPLNYAERRKETSPLASLRWPAADPWRTVTFGGCLFASKNQDTAMSLLQRLQRKESERKVWQPWLDKIHEQPSHNTDCERVSLLFSNFAMKRACLVGECRPWTVGQHLVELLVPYWAEASRDLELRPESRAGSTSSGSAAATATFMLSKIARANLTTTRCRSSDDSYLFYISLVRVQLTVAFKQRFSVIEHGIEEHPEWIHITGSVAGLAQRVLRCQVIQMRLHARRNVHVPLSKRVVWLQKQQSLSVWTSAVPNAPAVTEITDLQGAIWVFVHEAIFLWILVHQFLRCIIVWKSFSPWKQASFLRQSIVSCTQHWIERWRVKNENDSKSHLPSFLLSPGETNVMTTPQKCACWHLFLVPTLTAWSVVFAFRMQKSKPAIFQAPFLLSTMECGQILWCRSFTSLCRNVKPSETWR